MFLVRIRTIPEYTLTGTLQVYALREKLAEVEEGKNSLERNTTVCGREWEGEAKI